MIGADFRRACSTARGEKALVLLLLLSAAGCGADPRGPIVLRTAELPALPEPITNNAVAAIRDGDTYRLFSFLGLRAGKTWQDTSSEAFSLDLTERRWQRIAEVPGGKGRLAGAAVALRERIYVFGGYAVAADHSEISIATVHAYDPRTDTYTPRAEMPVPVDDTVALPYLDRYVFLISGWHDSGNVNLVQLYDADNDSWSQATPYPGEPVFGHAGGIVGEAIVVCDGVKIVVHRSARRDFQAADECHRGLIDAGDPTRIDWYALAPHGHGPLYRMAALGTRRGGGLVVFAGGSANPYNYDGIGYDGSPSAPSNKVFAYSLSSDSWRLLGHLDVATMDHRGLLEIGDDFIIVGGMREGQRVSADVLKFSLP